jgi:carboxymethylenebutenolidase
LIELATRDGQRAWAYVAEPPTPARAALVILPEIFGVNVHIRAVADQYAADGYFVVACATFERVRHGVELGYSAHDIHVGVGLKAAAEALPPPGVLVDVQAAIDHARAQGPVGLVGFCWGGLLTWRAACTLDGLSAAVVYYGGGMTGPAEIARMPRVPVMAHLSDRDASTPIAGIDAFRQAHADVLVHLYAASHGFNCDLRDSWDTAAAQLARERTLAFLSAHLR